jgi:mRNA interferase HigB
MPMKLISNKALREYVFNIGGHKYRLIASIAYKVKTVWIKAVLTHAEYDQGAWK